MPPHERSSARLAAEELYVQALSLDGSVDVEELARANPASADELRRLDAEWERVAGIHAALAAQGSLTQRLRKHYGAGVGTDLELDDSDGEADSLASRAVRELEAHAPRQSR
jgi:hypothetical protein